MKTDNTFKKARINFFAFFIIKALHRGSNLRSESPKKTVFLKQFPGFSKNTKLRAESQAEDHLIAENEIPVYTPNLNGAPLAKNILMIIE